MIENVAKKNGMNSFESNVYMDAILLFLLECKVTFLKYDGH
jgi:hypothetical protein